MTIYKDSTTGGQWHYCFKCDHAGDMIDLAAGVWGVSQAAAIRKLAQSGVPIPPELVDEQAEYAFTRIKKRRQAAALWQTAREQLAALTEASPIIRRLRERLALYSRISPERWLEGPGKMFGAATMAQVQDAMTAPGVTSSIRRNNGSLFFRQRGWRDVLLLPHFSAPHNLEGFLFIGREARREDRIYRRVDTPPPGLKHAEGGLFGLDTVTGHTTDFGRNVVAVDDAVMALRLQIRHAATSTKPLPLLAWYDRRRIRTEVAWHAVDRPVTIWAFRMNASAVYAAMRCEGKIALTPLQEASAESVGHYLRLHDPADHMRRVIARGQPWREALVEWSHDQPHGVIDSLLTELQGYDVAVDELARLMEFETTCLPEIRSVVVNGTTVTERSSGWHCHHPTSPTHRRERLYTEFVLRLDYVTTGRRPWYLGRVFWNGKQAKFASTPKGLSRAVQRACITSGLGVPRCDKPSIILERIATAFQRPQLLSPKAAKVLADSWGVKAPEPRATQYKPGERQQPKAPKLPEVVPTDFDGIDVSEDARG